MAWTDPAVKASLRKWGEMLKAGCCEPAAQMLAIDATEISAKTFRDNSYAYYLSGMWSNTDATNDFLLKEGVDYGLQQFPSMGLGNDDTSSIDTRELLVLNKGANPANAETSLGWMLSPEVATILAKNGVASTASKTPVSLFGPVLGASVKAVSAAKIQFVLGDLLPGDLVDEYRLPLQRFLTDPSEANIDKVLAVLEAKAATAYK